MAHVFLIAVPVILFLCVIVFVWGWWANGFFSRRGVKSPPAYFPLIGHMGKVLIQKEHFNDLIMRAYTAFPKERYVGILQFESPMLVIRDIELIKQVGIKDFDYFMDHATASYDEDADLVFGKGLFSLRGHKWRKMRTALSPAYTGSKIKEMFQFMIECGKQMENYFLMEMGKKDNKAKGLVELEMKDTFTRYSSDVVATCAFGLETNSYSDKSNMFYVKGMEASNFSGLRLARFCLLFYLPRIAKFLDIKIFSDKLSNFYRNLVCDTIKDREDREFTRRDLIQFLMEVRKGNVKFENNNGTYQASDGKYCDIEWSEDDIVAQAIVFFLGAFDTSSTVLSFLTHELAVNVDIQKRLQEEIDSTDGDLTLDHLQQMKYLDMVVSEGLRKWPPLAVYDRKCLRSYTLPPPNGSGRELKINEHFGVWIPVYAIHHDPQYFDDPEKFDPERFSDENKCKIKPNTYFPFGMGLRNCIGSRFAIVQVKIALYYILQKFDIVTTSRTQNPIKVRKDTFSIQSERGYWLGLRLRAT